MQAVKPPGSPSSKAHRAPGSLLVHLHSGPKPPFCPMMHQATRANYPPNSIGRVLPEKKFGGVNVGRRNSVLDSAGRVLPLSDIGPRAALQAPTSSCPGGPRAGSTAAGPRAVQMTSSYPQQPAGPRGQTGAPPPQDSSRFTTPHPSSSQPKATGGASQQFRTGKALHLRASKATSGWELHSWARSPRATPLHPRAFHAGTDDMLVHPLHLA